MKDRNFDMTIVAHAEPLDIDIYGRDPYYFNYKNHAFNALMKKVQETTDPDAQNTIYGEAQKILAEDVPALYLFVMPKLGVWDKHLKGLWENEPIPSNVLSGVSWDE
jgi:peptide/nickel transport system substrate-binding protein